MPLNESELSGMRAFESSDLRLLNDDELALKVCNNLRINNLLSDVFT